MAYKTNSISNLTLVQNTVEGTTETLVGSIYLPVQTVSVIRALLGETSAEATTAYLKIKRNTGGATVATLSTELTPATITATSVAIANADWYDLYLYTAHADGIAFCSGVRFE